VDTDIEGKNQHPGLYAAGEVSMTGVHGANRLASNSLLEALVFAARAAASSVDLLRSYRGSVSPDPRMDDSGTLNSEEWVLVAHDRREIQQIMWDYVGIVRSNLRLERALRRITLVHDESRASTRRRR